MVRISDETRRNNERAIRQVMEQLLAGGVPPGGKCDIKTLATQAGVTRTGFYPKKNRDGSPRPGPYQHLAEEFERRLARTARGRRHERPTSRPGRTPQESGAGLRDRLAERHEQLAELGEFKQRALSQIAAQQMEIQRLREALTAPSNLRALPRAQRGSAPFGSCS
ncbi:hypothetical protein QMZ92_31865 [Streptomyces sp. HNM0645]|uniref:hypothetical protein n=1 Tax=Streptomyces sp. HNM0645 TaxID=2782343 RepID=UPI0024B80C24|nr:hypothetical protein [Streptomyces sp. HNM0645]MDI9888826.1 hypothetical protein [Streptomyces sp. HNM0645]